MATTIFSTTDTKEDVTKAVGMYSKEPVQQESAQEQKEEKSNETHAEAKEAASEPAEKEAKSQQQDDVDEDGNEDTESSTEKPKKKGGFQKRIDKLTKAKTTAEQERDYWRDVATKSKTQADSQAQQQQQTSKAPEGKPNPDDFKTVGDYLEALSDWKYEQKTKSAELAKKTEEARSAHDNSRKGFQEKVKEFQKQAPDLEEVLAEVDHIPVPAALEEAFLNSEHGPQLMYELARDPEEYERIAKLNARDAYAEMKIREHVLKSKMKSESSQEVKTTKAPAPIKPVSRGSTVSTKDPGEMPYREYVEWYKKKFG